MIYIVGAIWAVAQAVNYIIMHRQLLKLKLRIADLEMDMHMDTELRTQNKIRSQHKTVDTNQIGKWKK